MKNLLYPIGIIILLACNLSGSNKKLVEDSLDYYPPTPKSIPKPEFRMLYNNIKIHFDSTLLAKGFSGQLLVAKNGAIIFERTLGFADFRTKDTLTSISSLHIASVSKTMTSMAVLHLMETGKLALEDTLGSYFPRFPYPGVTIRMLLSHRSGLPNYLNYLSKLKVSDTCYNNQDVLNSLFTLQPKLEFRSGSRFSYSNSNYVLLTLIIEKLAGESFPSYMKRVFFDPLQMKNTFVYAGQDSLKPTPSFQSNGAYWQPDPFDCTYGDKNIYTTTHDLLKWDQALYSGLLFKKETLDSAYAPLSNERPSIHNYGLGWRMIIFKNGKKMIYHNGRWHGSNASFIRLPDESATIIAIGNKFSWNIYSAAMHAATIFGDYFPDTVPQAGEEEQDNIASESTKKVMTSPKTAKSSKTKR